MESHEYLPLSAAEKGYMQLIQVLLCNRLNVNEKMGSTNHTMLRTAQCGNKNVAKLLLSRGADIEVRDEQQWTPLHWAAYNGHVSTVQLLIEKGADIKPQNNNGWTPLHIATRRGDISVEQCLLDNNCNREIKNNIGNSALDIATGKGCSNIVKLLDK